MTPQLKLSVCSWWASLLETEAGSLASWHHHHHHLTLMPTDTDWASIFQSPGPSNSSAAASCGASTGQSSSSSLRLNGEITWLQTRTEPASPRQTGLCVQTERPPELNHESESRANCPLRLNQSDQSTVLDSQYKNTTDTSINKSWDHSGVTWTHHGTPLVSSLQKTF